MISNAISYDVIILGFRNEIFIEMNKVTWRQYEVDENETLMSISIKPGFTAFLKIYGITRHTQREFEMYFRGSHIFSFGCWLTHI